MKNQAVTYCSLCPRKCNVDRSRHSAGVCKESDTIRVARAALHMWEEPCISGQEGSGTVFFTGCNLRCVYCQNYALSRSETGKEITIERLAHIFLELQTKGANNINLVTPTHFIPQIIEALKLSKQNGLMLPIIYNTSGYERVESLRLLEGLIDVYLPDFKYFSGNHAKRYSKAPDYPEIVKLALDEMYRQVGKAQFSEDHKIKKGMIVRHLVLPGQRKEAEKIVRYLFERYGDDIYLSLMNQYTPLKTLDAVSYPELNRKLTTYEYEKLIKFALELGVKHAYIQEGHTASESFIPAFTLEGV